MVIIMDKNDTLDAKGLMCPMPIVKLAKKMKDLKVGEVLELIADDVGSKEDVPAWCKRPATSWSARRRRAGRSTSTSRRSNEDLP